MFGVCAISAVAYLAAVTPHEVTAASSAFDWSHLLQMLFTALAAYFGSRQNRE